jgi:hypothetical protein
MHSDNLIEIIPVSEPNDKLLQNKSKKNIGEAQARVDFRRRRRRTEHKPRNF